MIDLTIIGGGTAARAAGDVLTSAGFSLRRTFELDDGDRSPVILGEIPSAQTVARQTVAAGRHLLIACPEALGVDRLIQPHDDRRKAQSLFIWSERRYHPSFHFISGLVETDGTWRPRYLRQETLLMEPASIATSRWTIVEVIALAETIAGAAPNTVSATGVTNQKRHAIEQMALSLGFKDLTALVQFGAGEALERRETLIASTDRKAFIDELNPSVPMRLVTDESSADAARTARWLSCPVPSREELARQQCLAFLDATLKDSLAQAEASLWVNAISTLVAAEESMRLGGAETRIERLVNEGSRFRLLSGPGRLRPSPSA